MKLKIENLAKYDITELLAGIGVDDIIEDVTTGKCIRKTEFGYVTAVSAINAVVSIDEPTGTFEEGTFWIKI